MKELYELIKSLIPTGVFNSITYQVYKEDKSKSCGIFLYSGKNDLKTLCGTSAEICKVQLMCTVGTEDENEIFNVQDCICEFVDIIEKSDGDSNILILSAEHTGMKCEPIGFNDKGLLVNKCTIELSYKRL